MACGNNKISRGYLKSQPQRTIESRPLKSMSVEERQVAELERALCDVAAKNPGIPGDLKREFPAAARAIAEFSERPIGLYGDMRPIGKGATSLVQALGNERTGHGAAYELVATWRLIEGSAPVSGSGKELSINTGDQLSFGVRVPAGGARRTVEADTLVHKPSGPVGIDHKFRSDGRYSGSKGLENQLSGVKHAIKRGSFKEYHFATNGQVSRGSRQLIDSADREIRREIAKVHQRAKMGDSSLTVAELGMLSIDHKLPVIGWVDALKV